MAIRNNRFWDYWGKGMYEEALKCSVEEETKGENRLQAMLFGNREQIRQTGAITGISAGEFIYDWLMIDPTVVHGLDFARAEDLSSLFSVSQFASKIDTTTTTGDIAQLQGYVAEQMLASELEAKGYDVEFPEVSNNAGWDILVDGQPFQVKNLASPEGVREHLERYPDIPVYVNEELATYFQEHPQVYVSSISREEVLEATTSTLHHADDLLNFEIPWISAGVSSIFNLRRVWKDDVSMNQAVFHVVSDTSSRVVLGTLGQKAGVIVGTMIFGPAGGITGAMFGTFVGASQGGRLSMGIKRAFSKKQEKELNAATTFLLVKVIEQIDEKITIKKRKMEKLKGHLLPSQANDKVYEEMVTYLAKDVNYLLNKKEEMRKWLQSIENGSIFVLEKLPQMMAAIAKSGVHPIHYQKELQAVQKASKEYAKRN